CTPACAAGAKASTDITYWPAARRSGIELRTHCRVREITTNEHGMAAGVVYYDADGVEQFQAAEVVVLACNGVGTPRLLLNSASGHFPNGLANSTGLVGKNLMFHPYAQVYGYVADETDSNRAPPTCLWSKEFYETYRSRGFVRGYTFQFGRGVGPVAEAVASEAKGLLPWGAGHHTAFRRLNGHRLGLSAICEDLPEEHNRVTLDPVLKDSHGIPAPRIDYSIAHDADVALGMALPPLLRPEIEDVMEINVGQEWRDHRALRRADFARPYLPVFHHPDLQPFADQADDPPVADAMFHEANEVLVVHRVEEAGDVGIQDPIHRRALDRHRPCIQRIVLTATRPETVAEAEEIFLVDGIQHFDRRPLDDLVLQRRDAERPLPPVRLGSVVAARWLRPVAAALDAAVQVRQLGCQTVAVVLPRQPVHPRCRFPLELEVGPAQQVDIDVVEQCGEFLR